MAPNLTEAELAVYHEDRRPQLYASLITLLVVNNLFVAIRLVAHYYDRYRHEKFGFNLRSILAEDTLMLMSGLFVNIMGANLLVATHFGLGLHSSRINHQDPNYPRNLSNAFRHVWITMVFTPATFTWIKLTLLFFYRRLFLVSQRWLNIAWWVNIVYVFLWLFGATGFYLFQCWPVQWYFMRYYSRYHRPSPYPISGQCNATNVTNVSRPLIFGLISDVAILLLPIFSISQLQMSLNKKIGLIGVFSMGVIACGTDMARIIELSTDTDDIVDPAYGVVIFLILSVTSATAGIVCACLPIIVPAIYKAFRRGITRSKIQSANAAAASNPSTFASNPQPGKSKGFTLLPDDASLLNPTMQTQLDRSDIELQNQPQLGRKESKALNGESQIWVERKVDIHFSESRRK